MKTTKNILLLITSCICIIVLCNRIVVHQTKPFIESHISKVPHNDFGLVLGTSPFLANGNKNLYFEYRMDAAALLYHSGKVDTLLVSGDNHVHWYNEPEQMKNSLIARGVPKAVIKLDYAGFRTLDSVIRSKKVFNCTSITIISQHFHNQRALFIANNRAVNAIAFDAKTPNRMVTKTPIREYLARCLAVFDVYFFNRKPKFL